MEIKDVTICFTLGKAQKNNEQKAYCIIMFMLNIRDIYI